MSAASRLFGVHDHYYPIQESWQYQPYQPHQPQQPPRQQHSGQFQMPQSKSFFSQSEYELIQPPPSTAAQFSDYPPVPDHAVSSRSTWRVSGWLWEILSFAIAVLCFAAIVGLLLGVHDRPVPKWHAGLSVNAILSVLVTIMKGAMGFCIAECLSQIKWTWFRQDRKLIDLVTIDNASRGIWGASRLLTTFRPWYLAYVGSIVLLLGFLIGPTVQLVVQTETRRLNLTSQATVPICNNSYYEVMGFGAGSGLNKVNLPMIGAMYNGFLQTNRQSPLKPSCPSGFCTYPRYQSFGVCHQCFDHSDQLLYVNATNGATMPTTSSSCAEQSGACNISWPAAGINVQATQLMITSQYDYLKVDQGVLPMSNYSLDTFLAVTAQHWRGHNDAPSAFKCDVMFCVKTYEASVEAGDFREQIVATSWNESSFDEGNLFGFTNEIIVLAKPCYVNGIEKIEPWNDEDRELCTYKINAESGRAMLNTFPGLTRGYGSAYAVNRPSFSNDVMQGIYGFFDTRSLDSSDLGKFDSVDRAFRSVVDVVTDQARGSVDNCGGATASGTLQQDELFTHVRWIWLIPAAGVLCSCLLFLIATVIQSRKGELWKSSPLAYLFWQPAIGHNELTVNDMVRSTGLGARRELKMMEKACESVDVRFRFSTGRDYGQ